MRRNTIITFLKINQSLHFTIKTSSSLKNSNFARIFDSNSNGEASQGEYFFPPEIASCVKRFLKRGSTYFLEGVFISERVSPRKYPIGTALYLAFCTSKKNLQVDWKHWKKFIKRDLALSSKIVHSLESQMAQTL